ncbi:unnamed protein product [Closterium sp. NIES-54]
MIEESGCKVHPGLPQGQVAWTRDELAAKSTSSATRADTVVDAREGSVTTVARKRATVGLAARRESDSGSGKAGREDAGGDGNGKRRGAVEGRSAIWCVPGTVGGRGRLVRRLVQAGRAGDAGRDAGARRSARPPVGPVKVTRRRKGQRQRRTQERRTERTGPQTEGSTTVRMTAREGPMATVAARRESDSGSGKAGREDAGGDGNGKRRGAVEGRSAIWCVPGTAGGRGRLVRRLVQAGRAGDAGRDAGARRSARPPVGPV